VEYLGLEEDKRLVQAVPSKRQIIYQNMEFFCFIHFTVNTYTGKEWGTGDEPESIFNPSRLDAEQWVKVAKAGGMKGVVLTCKHHDGFCLWPSKYTEHSIKNSPYKDGKGDIVKEVSDACNKYDMKFGVYLSPWDRNSAVYGMGKPYDDYYVNQLNELLSNYGDIYVVWLDGACGEGPNGKTQKYDWNRYFGVMRLLQPTANISICGPDVRWCGNESGVVRPSEWAVVAKDMSDIEMISQLSQHEDRKEFRERPIDCTQVDIGSRERLKHEKELIYYPAETDVSIRPGWFYHAEEDNQVRTFENLKEIYLNSVGGNTTLLLNLPPNKEGVLHENDVKVITRLGDFIRKTFSNNIADCAKISSVPEKDIRGNNAEVLRADTYHTCFENEEGNKKLEIKFRWSEARELSYLVLKEAIQFSQRVEKFTVNYEREDGCMEVCYSGTVIGYKKIVDLKGIETKSLKIYIEDARVAPIMSFAAVYGK